MKFLQCSLVCVEHHFQNLTFPATHRHSRTFLNYNSPWEKIICGKSESRHPRHSKQWFLEAPSLKYLLISTLVSLDQTQGFSIKI